MCVGACGLVSRNASTSSDEWTMSASACPSAMRQNGQEVTCLSAGWSEPCRRGPAVARGFMPDLGEPGQELPLLLTDVLRRGHPHVEQDVAAAPPPQVRDPLAPQPDHAA